MVLLIIVLVGAIIWRGLTKSALPHTNGDQRRNRRIRGSTGSPQAACPGLVERACSALSVRGNFTTHSTTRRNNWRLEAPSGSSKQRRTGWRMREAVCPTNGERRRGSVNRCASKDGTSATRT